VTTFYLNKKTFGKNRFFNSMKILWNGSNQKQTSNFC